MDFSLYDKINKAKAEETDNGEKGLNRVYNSLCYDYLYENPSSVMAFIENHDTDRFLGNGEDTLALKQALGLLLTIDRIPQLYYGTEVLMNGTKEVTDGNVRKDFPGGFPGDKHDCFTVEGRTKAENSMFDWLSKLLHWRQGNELITKGKQTQFCPHNGVYVVARQYDGKTSMTILNGTNKPAVMDVNRYAEIIGNNVSAKDVITGEIVRLDKNLNLMPRQTLIIEF
jgi:glycosidase